MDEDRQRFREVLAINRAIAGAEAYEEVLELVVERTAAFTNATACMLILSQAEGPARIVSSVGIDPAKAAGLAVPLTESINRELRDLLDFDSPDRFLGVPVVGKEGLLGILAVYWEGTHPSPDASYEAELVSALADQAAIALDSAERVRRLRASESKLANLISTAADAIISIDQSQRIVMFNEGAEKIFGWSPDEVLGKPLDILLPERLQAIHRQHVSGFGSETESARRMGQRTHLEIVGVRKSGEEFPADAAVSKVDDGGEWMFTVVLRDVTEQKRIESEQRFLAEVGLSLADLLDYQETVRKTAELAVRQIADLCIVDCLAEGEEILRLEVASRDPSKTWVCELLAQTPIDRRGPHLLRSVIETREPVVMQRPSAETIASLAQSSEHHRALRAAEIHSMVAVPLVAHGELLGAIACISSTASRAYGPADVKLVQKVAQRAALSISNARLYRTAQQATQARDDVLGVVAHDLRNPLGTIQMSAALLRRQGSEPTSGTRRAAEKIERSANRMNRLIEDLLDVTRMEAGQLFIEPARVSARDVITESMQAHEPAASSRSIELLGEAPGDPGEIWGDFDRLLQLFDNLIGNALKFTEPGGRATIGAKPRDGEILFWVADTGPGIAAEDLPHLFDRFWQAKKTERRGAGLGLPIARGIVESHGGSVWVESTPGQGSTFFFTIPTARPTV